jgi:hypothetical protein
MRETWEVIALALPEKYQPIAASIGNTPYRGILGELYR